MAGGMQMLIALLLAQLALSGSGVAGCLTSLELQPPGSQAEQFQFPGLELSGSEPAEVIVDLDLGQSLEGYEVVLRKEPRCATEFRVQWQYETSVTVMNEGPHVDLLDWKHFTSSWLDIEPNGAGRYRLPTLTDEQRMEFPQVSPSELVEAVRAEGGDRWAELAANVKTPHAYPSAVGLSAYRVRVVQRVGSEWQVLHSATFRFPMGC